MRRGEKKREDGKVFFHFTEPTVTDCDVNKSRTINPSGSAALVCRVTGPLNLFPSLLFLLHHTHIVQRRERNNEGTENQTVSHTVRIKKNRLLQRTKESKYYLIRLLL